MLDAVLECLLDQGRRIHTPDHTVCDRSRTDQRSGVIHLIRDHNISDTLTRNRKRLTVRVSHNRIVVELCHKRNIHSAVSKLAVRLIRDQYDRCAELLLLLLHDRSQCFDRRLIIDNTCRVVRIVDDDSLRSGSDLRLKLIKLRHKCLRIRRNDHYISVIVSHIRIIFHKIRCKYDHFIARIQNTL